MIRLLVLLCVVLLASIASAQDCPVGTVCPQSAVQFAPVRGALNVAANVAGSTLRNFRTVAAAPFRAVGGSAGNVSVARYSVPVVREYATVTSQRTYRVRSWQPMKRVRVGGSRGR